VGSRLPQPADEVFLLLGILYFFYEAVELCVFVAAVAVEGEPELQDYLPHQLPPSVPPGRNGCRRAQQRCGC
jgi:hypothetical protein